MTHRVGLLRNCRRAELLLRVFVLHYYKFNIADWNLGTSHLSLVEEAIYFRLINFYYDTESPIPLETQSVFRRLRFGTDSDTASLILDEFFTKTDSGWIHERCDKVLKEYRKTAKKNKANGAKGGRPSKDAALKETQDKPTGLPNESQNNPNQEPLTKNHKPETTNKNNSAVALVDFSVFTMMTKEQISEMRRIRKKNKGGAITDRVAKALANEFNLALQNGLTVDQCLTEWEVRTWKSFKADWMKSGNGYASVKAAKQKEADDWANSSGTGMFDYGDIIDGEVINRE